MALLALAVVPALLSAGSLHELAHRGDSAGLETALASAAAAIDTPNKEGDTALHIAAVPCSTHATTLAAAIQPKVARSSKSPLTALRPR